MNQGDVMDSSYLLNSIESHAVDIDLLIDTARLAAGSKVFASVPTPAEQRLRLHRGALSKFD